MTTLVTVRRAATFVNAALPLPLPPPSSPPPTPPPVATTINITAVAAAKKRAGPCEGWRQTQRCSLDHVRLLGLPSSVAAVVIVVVMVAEVALEVSMATILTGAGAMAVAIKASASSTAEKEGLTLATMQRGGRKDDGNALRSSTRAEVAPMAEAEAEATATAAAMAAMVEISGVRGTVSRAAPWQG